MFFILKDYFVTFICVILTYFILTLNECKTKSEEDRT